MVKNILVIRNDRFGEFLLVIPALRALKEAHAKGKLTLAVNPQVKELAGLIEGVDEVFVWDELKRDLRRRKFDLCVIFNPAKEAHIAAFLSGIPVRVGYDRKWGFLLTHKIKDTKHLGNRHEVVCNLELVDSIGAKTADKSISLNKIPAQNFSEYSGAIAIHPFTSDPVKQWPVERFIGLAKRLAPFKVVLVGKTEDQEQFQPGNSPLGVINLINKTSLVELAQVLKQCKLLITCDSGPMHLAAAVGIPVVALFRNDLPGKSAQRWGPWGEGHRIIEKAGLKDIEIEEVLAAVKDKLR